MGVIVFVIAACLGHFEKIMALKWNGAFQGFIEELLVVGIIGVIYSVVKLMELERAFYNYVEFDEMQ